MTTTKLRLRRLLCPPPAQRTRKAQKRAALGDRLEVTCTDPLATVDTPNLVNAIGDLIERAEARGDTIVFVIQKRGKGRSGRRPASARTGLPALSPWIG
jgi:tRNA 2-thiouridine synthesizing protein A